MGKTLLILLSLALTSISHAQGGYWQQLNGPTGGYSVAIASGTDNTVYLLSDWLLWKRSPEDPGWVRMGRLPFFPDFIQLAPAPFPYPNFIAAFGKLFVGGDLPSGIVQSNPGTLWSSSDEGETWNNTGIIVCEGITVSGSSLYALGAIPGAFAVFRSDDSGSSWNNVFTSTTRLISLTGSPSSHKLYVGTSNGIYSNTQGDSVWSLVSSYSPSDGNSLQLFEVDSSICMATWQTQNPLSSPFLLFRSTDAGHTWDTIDNLGAWAGIISKDSAGDLWQVQLSGHGNQKNLSKSTDSGKTWQAEPFNFVYDPQAYICTTPSGTMVMKSLEHVYRYSSSSSQWSPWEDSLRNSNIFSVLAISNDSLLVVSSGGFYRSSDDGGTWSNDSIDDPDFLSQGTVSPPNFIGYQILRSPDGSLFCWTFRYDPNLKEWVTISDTIKGRYQPLAILAVDSSGNIYSQIEDVGFVNGMWYSELLRSSDKGAHWDTLPSTPYSWNTLTIDAHGRILGCSQDGGYAAPIFRSSDSGRTWNKLGPQGSPYFTAVTPRGDIFASILGSDSVGTFYMMQSSDDGTSWEATGRTTQIDCFAVDGDSSVFLVNGYGEIMKTSGANQSWKEIYASSDTEMYSLAVSPDRQLFAGSFFDGLFRYVPSSSSVETTVSAPETFSIFPNPAANQIHITSSEGNISILDPLGRSYEVNQTGNTLDISALPSGVYFTSDGHSRAKFVKE